MTDGVHGAINRWTLWSWSYALIVVAAFGYCLLGVPIQVSDSYGNLVQATSRPLGELVYNQFYQRSFLRPLLWGQLRVLYDLSGGNYFEWFRGYHVLQVLVLVVLFLRLVRPRTAALAAAVPLGLAALLGIHTFAGTVREAFPINTFMTILICCFGAADLALGPRQWWRDTAAAILFVFASLTVESGLLVGVVFVAAYLAGARGVSKWGVATLLALTAGYMYLRFVVLGVGSPDLLERSSGFLFSTREPSELLKMFGGNPLPFYAYNVIASLLSVLFAEPRGGIFAVTRNAMAGEPTVAGLVSVVASGLGTAMIVAYGWRRRAAWRARQFDRADQLVIVFALVALANAAISYAYTKDVIMSPAGAFFAVALTVAVADYLGAASSTRGFARAAAFCVVLVLSSAWAFRAVNIHVGLRHSAGSMRNEWAYVDAWLQREGKDLDSPAAVALRKHLQDDAVLHHPAQPPLIGDWVEWFED